MEIKPHVTGKNFDVILPCSVEEFSSFISNLLGKPQTIEKFFRGTFYISADKINDIFQLVNQRISQQNEANLIQFSVKVFFDDDSSVLVNSMEAFKHYNEIGPLKSVGVTLSLSYLVKFQQRKSPEKQQIDLSFRTEKGGGEIIFEDGIFISKGRRYLGPGGIFLRINHTERTWGQDIEALLSGYIKSLIERPNKLKAFVLKHSGTIGLFVGGLVFIGAFIGSIIAVNKAIILYTNSMKSFVATSSSADLLIKKIDFLGNVVASGWPKLTISIITFIVCTFFTSIFLGIWVGSKADKDLESFVLLSRISQEQRMKAIDKQRRDWFMFWLSVAVSIGAGLISNLIFNLYFCKI